MLKRSILVLLSVLAALFSAAVALAEQHYEPLPVKLAQTADFTVVAASVELGGWSVRETAGSTASIIIRNASDTDSGTGGVQCNASGGVTQVGGQALEFINLTANQTVGDKYLHGIPAPLGLCVDVVSGSVDFKAYIIR